jgi:hypothetical protein
LFFGTVPRPVTIVFHIERMFSFRHAGIDRTGSAGKEPDVAKQAKANETQGTQGTEPGRPACLCGCGGTPKGKKSRFVPGHDARYHSAEKKAAAEAAPAASVRVNAGDRPRRPSRRRAGHGDTAREPGSDA